MALFFGNGVLKRFHKPLLYQLALVLLIACWVVIALSIYIVDAVDAGKTKTGIYFKKLEPVADYTNLIVASPDIDLPNANTKQIIIKNIADANSSITTMSVDGVPIDMSKNQSVQKTLTTPDNSSTLSVSIYNTSNESATATESTSNSSVQILSTNSHIDFYDSSDSEINSEQWEASQ